jgi:hypothetical protein
LFSGDIVKLSVTAPELPTDIIDAVDRALLVDRTARAPNVDELGDVMGRYAASTLAIALLRRPSAARVALGSSPDALGSTQLASTGAPGSTSSEVAALASRAGATTGPQAAGGGGRRWLIAALAVVVIGGPGAWLATRGSTTPLDRARRGATQGEPPIGQPDEPATSRIPATLPPLSPSSQPTAVVSAVASSPPPPLASAKKPGGRPSASASSTKAPTHAPAAASAIKLQGGVAGDTPF